MKTIIVSLLLITLNAYASTTPIGIICQEDNRMSNGALKEMILMKNNKGFSLQSQFIASINAPSIEREILAEELDCRIDDKSPIAFCKNPDGTKKVYIKDRRETLLDSLNIEDKKKTAKFTDITLTDSFDNVISTLSFTSTDCSEFNG